VEDQPFLALAFGTDAGLATIGVIYGTSTSKWFISSGSGWRPRFGGHFTLTQNTASRQFVLTSLRGGQTIFHDNSTGVPSPLRGKLKSMRSPGGGTATVTWTAGGLMTSIAFSGPSGVGSASLIYQRYTDANRAGLIESVSLQIEAKTVKGCRYDYYLPGATHGPSTTLAYAVVEEPDPSGVWRAVKEQRYRYYKTTGAGAFAYGLKLQLQPAGVAAAREAGYDLDTASDDALAPYASHRFTFDTAGRVTQETVRGGEASSSFVWMTSAIDPGFSAVNTWYRRCIENRPDGSAFTVYTNRSGSTLLSILNDVASGSKWYDYRQYDANHREILRATPAAIQSVIEPSSPSGTLTVTLRTAGLINVSTYYDVDDIAAGKAKGFLATEGVKNGSGGAVEVQRKLLYDTRTVDGISIRPVREELQYPGPGTLDADAARTQYARTWHNNSLSQPTFQVNQLTVTPPIVPVSQRGTGLAEPVFSIFDLDGLLIWEKNARGVITWRAYDFSTASVVRRIDDANPALLPNPPSGWVAPSIGGAHLTYDYLNDDQGRVLRVIEPEHSALIDDKEAIPC